MVHVMPGPKMPTQLLVCANSLRATTAVMLTGAGPVLVTVTGRGADLLPKENLPKFSPPGETFKNVPIPTRLVVCGLVGSASLPTNVPLCEPAWRGAKATLIVHCAPAGSAGGQLLVCVKSPVIAMLLIAMTE